MRKPWDSPGAVRGGCWTGEAGGGRRARAGVKEERPRNAVAGAWRNSVAQRSPRQGPAGSQGWPPYTQPPPLFPPTTPTPALSPRLLYLVSLSASLHCYAPRPLHPPHSSPILFSKGRDTCLFCRVLGSGPPILGLPDLLSPPQP